MISLRYLAGSRLAVTLAVTAVLAGCSKDEILSPELPDVIEPDAVENAQGAPAIYAGAISELVFAHDGPTGLALYASLFTDEMMHSSTPPAVREWDLRGVTIANSVANNAAAAAPGPFLGLNRARTALEISAERVRPHFAADDSRVGELIALAGMTYILAGEHFCSGAPFSSRSPSLEYGESRSTEEMFNLALERLTTAGQETGVAGTPIANLIAVLRGRAELNLGNYAAAAAAVASVPTTFEYQFFHSTGTARQQNNFFLQNENDIYSVSNEEGGNGLNFATAGDPRVPVEQSTRTETGNSRNDTVTPQYYFRKFTSSGDAVTVASGLEARLIEAEAALQAGDPGTWLSKINEVRGQFDGFADATDPGTEAGRVDLMFRERAFTMFLTGHRLGDLRRLVRQYGRGIETVYPTGAYHKQGLTRGVQASIIVPQTEQNNPNYDETACNPGAA